MEASRKSTFSAEASRNCAKTSPSPARVQGSTEIARVFGPSSLELLAAYDPDTCSWRTSQLSLLGGLAEFSETWPRSGTTRNGTAYRRQPLVPRTSGIASGLLPTPTATPYGSNRGGGAGRTGKDRPSLETMARKGLWRTPQARDGDHRGAQNATERLEQGHSMGLSEQVVTPEKWPTPTVSDATGGPGHAKTSTGAPNLRTEVNGTLNPEFVEWLMGFPIGWTECEPSETPSSRRSPKS